MTHPATHPDLPALVAWFGAESGQPDAAETHPGGPRAALADLLTARPALSIDDDIDAALHRLLADEAAARLVTDVADLTPSAGISLWQGDITTLRADVIVNAANSQMLGCFAPGHACIDNAIHAAAGPWLRAECATLMRDQGHPEPTGRAHLTAGHHLPARWVAHTVGPVVRDHTPTEAQAAQLASCYTACLDAAAAAGATSIAFCSISTGVFGYPIQLAAPVALAAVRRWLADHDTAMHVVLNTFSDADTRVYADLLAAAEDDA